MTHASGTTSSPGGERPRWVPVAEFAAPHEAEMARQILEPYGIPVWIRGAEVGIFGPGFSGPSAHGVTLHAPSDRAGEARELISDLVDGFGAELLSDDPDDQEMP